MRAPGTKDDKYSRGVVGFVTGSNEYPGAAVLGVSAALSCSIGMVRYVGPQRVQDLVLAAHPEAVCRESFAQAGRASTWVIGSGVADTAAEQVSSIQALFQSASSVRAVVDAGALDVLNFDDLRTHSLLLTPHAGELARLLNRLTGSSDHSAESVAESSFLVAGLAAKLTGQTVLLKGSRTVVAAPSGECRIIGPNSAHLATAGSGDILAGILGAIAAANTTDSSVADKKFSWLDVSELAVRLHSAAAELAAEKTAVNATAILVALGELTSGLMRS